MNIKYDDTIKIIKHSDEIQLRTDVFSDICLTPGQAIQLSDILQRWATKAKAKKVKTSKAKPALTCRHGETNWHSYNREGASDGWCRGSP